VSTQDWTKLSSMSSSSSRLGYGFRGSPCPTALEGEGACSGARSGGGDGSTSGERGGSKEEGAYRPQCFGWTEATSAVVGC
jgi:hypothetical protein